MRFEARRFSQPLMYSPGMEIIRPVWVVTRATEIPEAMARTLPVPNTVMTSKVSIIPTTVPKSPMSGATADSTPIKGQVLVQRCGQPL